MIKFRHAYLLGERLYIRKDKSCDEGVVTDVILSVGPNGDKDEKYTLRCSDSIASGAVTEVAQTKEELIDKLVQTQVDNLLPVAIKVMKKFFASIITKEIGVQDQSNHITIFPRLNRQGYIVKDNTIETVKFSKVEYIKSKGGVEVKFYPIHRTNTHYDEYYTEAFATIDEASAKLRSRYAHKLNHDCDSEH